MPFSAQPHPKTILLVDDDNKRVCDITGQLLRLQGFKVLTATSGEAALSLAKAHAGPIDLLIADVVMPGLKGPQVAERLRASRQEVRVLFISGLVGEAGLASHRRPATGFLAKPFDGDTLAEKVQQVLKSRVVPLD
jgi:two-component system, cell cycle sensor histidine kinase and response regulator CckA